MPKVLTVSTAFPATHPRKGDPTHFVEKILKSLDPHATYWAGQCGKCGWMGTSNNMAGGGPIADTGDYADTACPKCFSTDLDSEPIELGYYQQHPEVWPKHHTIRAGRRFHTGDTADLRCWSGRPYGSRQIQIATVQVRVWNILKLGDFFFWADPGNAISDATLTRIIHNDGLERADFFEWFKAAGRDGTWRGQIICWGKEVNYG
jgi:hypothetical protein